LLFDVNFDNVIKQYCLDQVDEHCDHCCPVWTTLFTEKR